MALVSVIITVTTIGTDAGPFTVSDGLGNTYSGVTRSMLLAGYLNQFDDTATNITVTSTGVCTNSLSIPFAAPVSPTPAASVSVTPTVTVTPSITITPTNSPAPGASLTPTPTITPSITETPVVTATPSITITPSITETPGVTVSPSITPTPTISDTPAVTPSVTPSPVPLVGVQVKLINNAVAGTVCGTGNLLRYTDDGTIGDGKVLTNAVGAPVTGYTWVVLATGGAIYPIDPVTGGIGPDSGDAC